MENTMNHKKYFSKMGLFLFLSTLIIFAVQYLAVYITDYIPAVANNSNLSFLATMLPMYIIAYPIIFFIFSKIPVQLTGEKKKMRVSHIIIAFLICYAGTYILNLITTLFTWLIGYFKQDTVDHVMLNITSSISPVVNLLIVVICAPIMEELLFRKTLIDRTAQFGEGISLVFSGLVFGLFHGNLVQFAYAFVLGMFFGFVYIKTKNIIYPITLHIMTNFIGSFVSSIIMDASGYLEFVVKINEMSAAGATEAEFLAIMIEYMGGLILFFGYALLLIALVITGVVLFFVNLKKFKVVPGAITIEKGQRFSTLILNIGMILYGLFWIVQIIMQLLG